MKTQRVGEGSVSLIRRRFVLRLLLFHFFLSLPLGMRAQFITETNNGGITITRYSSSEKALNIPATLGGLPVVCIGPTAFQFAGLLTNVVIPESVTRIEFGAFSGTSLVEITIPKGVTNIGAVAFPSRSLKSINVDPLNSTYCSIDGVLFDKSRTRLIQCPGGRSGDYVIPDGVITIADMAFGGNLLTNVSVPNGVRSIEGRAFASCYGLTNVTIGSGVTNIGYGAEWLTFNGSPELAGINVDARNPVYRSVDGVLIHKRTHALLKFPEGKAGSYTIPDNVTTIGTHAFSEAEKLTSVVIPDSVETIEANAFEDCAGLTNVTFGSKVKDIGEAAFLSCTSLTSAKFPNSVVNIGAAAFYLCNNLTNVILGKSVAKIGKNAFPDSHPLVKTVDAQNPNFGNQDNGLISKHPSGLAISFTEPANGAAIDAMCVDVHGVFKAEKVRQITVGGLGIGERMPATIKGNMFEAPNVYLQPGTNKIFALVEDFEGNEASNILAVIGPTDTNTARTLPVQLTLTPSAGFAPLTVTLKVEAHVPGKIQKVFYDFDSDGNPDQTESDLRPVTHTYKTGTEYFPVVTIQTTIGRFSSLSGEMLMFASMFGQNRAFFVNVQAPPVVLATIKVTDPVDVKWSASSNLYVLSGSTATITELSSAGKIIRSKNQLGANPSGFAVDADGNVYVAVTGKNQVWKYKPTADSFEADTSFGSSGFVGNQDGSPGSGPGQFNQPFDVVLSSDRTAFIVSDSGNQRLQTFAVNGALKSDSRNHMSSISKTPYGLWDDGLYLFVVDSGNDRIVLSESMDGFVGLGTSGTNGSELGQFKGATHISSNNRGIYVADTGNNRVQVFDHLRSGEGVSRVPFQPRIALSRELGLDHPKAVAAVNDLLEEKFYIADTGNNRVLLVELPADNPEAVWKELIAKMKSGDMEGALSCFSIASRDKYQSAFAEMSKEELRSTVKDMENIKPVTVEGDEAEYHFESVVQGTTLTFPVHFDKEFGRWKVMEY